LIVCEPTRFFDAADAVTARVLVLAGLDATLACCDGLGEALASVAVAPVIFAETICTAASGAAGEAAS
jgi:hypothetical protein